MVRPKAVQPAYQFHISGHGRVILDGQDFYLGLHGTAESYARHYALLAEYNANWQKAPAGPRRLARLDASQGGAFIRLRDFTADFEAKALPHHESSLGRLNRFCNLCDLLDQRHEDDVEILSRRWIVIDVDPKWPTGISAASQEQDVALIDEPGLADSPGQAAPRVVLLLVGEVLIV